MAITKVNSLGVSLTSPVTFPAGTVSLPSITTSGDTNTGVFFSAADTIDFAEGGVATGQFDSSGNLKFNSGYGSVATAYGCRAWVNFNGTGTPAIRASGNVTSITDNGTGDYTVNFTNAMPDANYSASAQNSGDATVGTFCALFCTPLASSTPTTSSFRFITIQRNDGAQRDPTFLCVSVFR